MRYLKFLKYIVNEIHFKSNREVNGENQFQVNPNIRVDVRKENNIYLLSITVTVDKSQPTLVPFELVVNVAGSFMVENEGLPADMLDEGFSFLYPFVRSIVSNLTVNANMPAYFLPVINLTSKKAEKKADNADIIITPVEE